MRQKFGVYLIYVLFVLGFVACGGDSEDDAEEQPTKPATSAGSGEAIQLTVDFPVEEEALKEVFTLHALSLIHI